MQVIVDKLLNIPIFQGLPIEQIEWLASQAKLVTFAKGERILKQGDPIDALHIITSGCCELRIERNGNLQRFQEMRAGEVTGALPYSRGKTALGEVLVREDSEVILVPRSCFPEMIRSQYELTERMVHTLTSRVRDFTKVQQFNEKLVALGKIAAGLAHELNNPSAAVLRSASELKKHLAHLPDKFKKVIKIQMNDQQVDVVNNLLFGKVNQSSPEMLSLMDRTDKEDEIAEWLEEHGIEDAYDFAPDFVEFGMEIDDLDTVAEQIEEEKDLEPVFQWLENVLTTEKLVREIEEASNRISDLVSSIKIYSHMDRSTDKQDTDVHVGIINTLKILKHKFKKNNVQLQKGFQDQLPTIKAMPGELNQVWTNLIDNALDAMEKGGGDLTINTYQENEFVKIEVVDSGEGIPPDIQTRIFDPFFTTKDIGKGTGVGLDVVHRIISQHRGDIKVNSEPGNTKFTVCLPIE